MHRSTFLLVLLVLTAEGCGRARHYDPPSPPREPSTKAEKPSVDPLLAWMLPDTQHEAQPGLPLVFVAEDTDPMGWQNFPDRALVERPTTFLLGWSALKVPGLVRVKVPRGLPDPSPLVPAANPLTLGKWRLGRSLFHDPTWLTAGRAIACATCHRPDRAFTDGLVHDGVRTPTLVNAVYNRRQFCDGRAVYLEEVIQQSLDDELLPEDPPENPRMFRHAWGGVLHRLRANARRLDEFETVFGNTLVTQDAVGKALATYLRTLLAGDSLHDRAEAARRARGATAALEARDYEAALDNAFLTSVGQPEGARAAVAARLVQGHKLFQVHCVRCHLGPLFTDHGYHNLGVPPPDPQNGTDLGRFGTVPVGLKERDLMGAYATPTLRGLTRTGPYLHTGKMATLAEVVHFHARGGRPNNYLDPDYRRQHEIFGTNAELLKEDEQADLVLFLQALGGTEVPPAIRQPPG